MNLDLAKLLLPSGIIDYFEITSIREELEKIHIYLEEKSILPQEYKAESATSKGFLDVVVIEDFPLRGKEILLHIKRRKWKLTQSNKYTFLDGIDLTFEYKYENNVVESSIFTDNEGNKWSIFGEAINGPRKGERLKPVRPVVSYWFAIAAFYPDPEIY